MMDHHVVLGFLSGVMAAAALFLWLLDKARRQARITQEEWQIKQLGHLERNEALFERMAWAIEALRKGKQ